MLGITNSIQSSPQLQGHLVQDHTLPNVLHIEGGGQTILDPQKPTLKGNTFSGDSTELVKAFYRFMKTLISVRKLST